MISLFILPLLIMVEKVPFLFVQEGYYCQSCGPNMSGHILFNIHIIYIYYLFYVLNVNINVN